MFKHRELLDEEEKETFIKDLNSLKGFLSNNEYMALMKLSGSEDLTKDEFLSLYLLKNIILTDDEKLRELYDDLIRYVKDVLYTIIDEYDIEVWLHDHVIFFYAQNIRKESDYHESRYDYLAKRYYISFKIV